MQLSERRAELSAMAAASAEENSALLAGAGAPSTDDLLLSLPPRAANLPPPAHPVDVLSRDALGEALSHLPLSDMCGPAALACKSFCDALRESGEFSSLFFFSFFLEFFLPSFFLRRSLQLSRKKKLTPPLSSLFLFCDSFPQETSSAF